MSQFGLPFRGILVSPSSKSRLIPGPLAQAIWDGLAVLAKFGANAHFYLSGAGQTITGLQAQNYLDSAGTTLATVDNPVGLVKDAILSGAINASQATPANKPTLCRGVTNLLTYSGDLTNAAWAQQNGGSATANTVTFAAGSGSQRVQSFSTASVPVTVAAKVSVASGTKTFRFKIWNGTVDQYSSDFTATTTPQVFTFTATGGSTSAPNISICNSTIGDVGTVIVDGVGLFTGTLTAYQILACGGIPLTTSAAASSSAGNWGWGFDGTKYFSLASVPFTVADSFSVVIGTRVDDTAANRTIYSHSNAANNQLPWIYFGTNGSVNVVFWDGTTTVSLISPLSYTGQNIVVGFRKSGATATLRINGTQVATASLAAITNQALTTATIAGFNGPNLLHVGEIFAADVCKANVTDADMLTQERMVGALTGPTGVTF